MSAGPNFLSCEYLDLERVVARNCMIPGKNGVNVPLVSISKI